MTPWFLDSATRGRLPSTELKWRRQFLLRQVHRYLQSFIISKDLHPHMALCASSSCERKSWDLFFMNLSRQPLFERMNGWWCRLSPNVFNSNPTTFLFWTFEHEILKDEHYHVWWKIIPTFNQNFWFYWNYFEK